VVEDIVIAQTMRSIFQSHSLDAIVEHVMMWQKKENTTLPLLQRMADFDLANHDNKQRIVDTFINSIYVYDDRLVINFNCREDSETIPLELSVFGSDLTMMGEPYWNSPNIKKCSDFLVFVPALDVFAMRVGIFN